MTYVFRCFKVSKKYIFYIRLIRIENCRQLYMYIVSNILFFFATLYLILSIHLYILPISKKLQIALIMCIFGHRGIINVVTNNMVVVIVIVWSRQVKTGLENNLQYSFQGFSIRLKFIPLRIQHI